MKAIIVEDEIFAAQSLQSLIQEVDAEIEILTILPSIDESVEWFRSNPVPDLVFMDIHLADGSSFAIFDEFEITCPVVFTTAYDEYALKAFEVNSIDYLLKPINRKDLERAIGKYKNMTAAQNGNAELLQTLIKSINKNERSYKSCFLVPEKDKLVPIATADIACIFIDEKMVKAITFAGKTHYLDQSLDDLTSQLNPNDFYRANRQYLISRKAVKDLTLWFGSKLVVNLTVTAPDKIIVSKLKAGEIKRWVAM
jgi:two-component system LytT family response regulator